MDSKNFNRRDFARVAGLVGLASVGGSVVSQGLYSDPDRADRVHHYVFFQSGIGDEYHDAAFLQAKAFEGAQLKYIWRELETTEGQVRLSRNRTRPGLSPLNG
jgi:hypothetical protein